MSSRRRCWTLPNGCSYYYDRFYFYISIIRKQVSFWFLFIQSRFLTQNILCQIEDILTYFSKVTFDTKMFLSRLIFVRASFLDSKIFSTRKFSDFEFFRYCEYSAHLHEHFEGELRLRGQVSNRRSFEVITVT